MMDCQALSIVIFVWMIIAYQAISYAYLFLPLLFNENQTLFWLLTPFFTIFVVFICITYYLSIYTKPGHPSFELNTIYSEQIQQLKKNAKLQQEQKRSRRQRKKQGLSIEFVDQINNLTKISFCFKCQVVKQPRVHHCKICRKCILRMDHHCPWVGNCVGKMNHKYFILFLLYATLGLLLVSISIFIDIMTGSYYLNQLDEGFNYILYFTCFSSFALSLSIGFLFITQIMGSKNNLTTLDTFVDQMHERNPWTRGSWKQNFRQIFGDSWWFLPTSPFSSQQISQSLHKTGYSVESL